MSTETSPQTPSTTAPVTGVVAFTYDSSDASRLARFYADLTGGEVTAEYPEYGVAQTTMGTYVLNIQGVEGFTRPQWPGQDSPQQAHLDLRVDDLDAAVRAAVALGAEEAAEQPSPEAYRVLLDPDGHPFCLCPPSEG